jgi:hypothetical protein
MGTRGRRDVIETNRIIFDSVRKGAKFLRRHGLDVEVAPHKTTLIVERPEGVTWRQFRKLVAAVLQPRIGSAVIFSEWSGRSYVCSNRGNRPGEFVEL